MMRRSWFVAIVMVLAITSCTSRSAGSPSVTPIRVGAIYPLSGSQGPGGRDEYRGVQIATDLVNQEGGVNGAPVELDPIDVPLGEDAPAAIDQLADGGIGIVLGSYGTTISEPAANEAGGGGWCSGSRGAVGSMPPPGGGSTDYFRVAPSGANLGRDAVDFIGHRLAPMLGRSASGLRFGVVSVDDAYGSTVADGAIDEDPRVAPALRRAVQLRREPVGRPCADPSGRELPSGMCSSSRRTSTTASRSGERWSPSDSR